MPFPCFAIIMAFVVFFTIKRLQVTKEEERQKSAFWQKEAEANHTRKKDISALPYITIPKDELPFGADCSEEVSTIEEEIIALSNEKILNLTGISNTDLKLSYGAANLNLLTSCDVHFTRLVRALNQWGQTLAAHGHSKEAITVLHFAVSCGSDITATYVTLARLYQELGCPDQISLLYQSANELKSLSKEGIIRHLSEFVHTSP